MSNTVSITAVTVTFNGMAFLEGFLNSLFATDQQGIHLEVILVDNGSTDGTVQWVRENFPQVRVIENDENNYAKALNVAIANSASDFVAITNNDATVHPDWLQGFLTVFRRDDKIGAVQSKILFSDSNRINSVGVQEVEHFYFGDIGFDLEDSSRYSKPKEREYVTGGSVMFRRTCLEDVGPWDEEFIMFMEDVDYSARCRAKGWKLWYSPSSILYHQYHGSSSQALCEYFCTRNRLRFVAKHFPLELVACIPTSHFFQKGELDNLYRSLLHAVQEMTTCHDAATVKQVLQELRARLPEYLGDVGTYMFFSHLEVLLGLRKIRVGIYDHAGHFAGGGQRYVAEMADHMQDRYDVGYIFNNDVELSEYKDWFDLNLDRCSMKIIKIPFFEDRNRYTADEGMVLGERTNPFDIIAKETLNYDIFINANMLGKVNPLSAVSIFVCHFPDQERTRFFQVDKYDHLVINGDYTGEWVKRRWNMEPTRKLYPPVNMYNPQSNPDDKEKIILSVSRFEISGSKKQVEMINTFAEMVRQYPEETRDWKLMLVGGSTPGNTYIEEVERAIANANCNIEYKANAAVSEIRDFYRRAAIFWHACGLDEERPERVEHFGMTTVESMQNCCVPIVIDGGGQREIVEHGDSGFRFSTLEELMALSLTVMGDRHQCRRMAERAYRRSGQFNRKVFRENLDRLLADAELQLLGQDVLPRPSASEAA
ncbi:MAG: glycosyltransferase [Halioglobus sp.]|nr:glycosyltransferase [Halioglobus sp.]